MTSKKITDLFDDVGHNLKLMLRAVDGRVGLMMVEKDGAVAALVAGENAKADPERLVRVLKLFRDRMDSMIEHAEAGDLALDKDEDRIYIHDGKTGDYHEGPTLGGPPLSSN